MKKIAIIGASYLQKPLVIRAKEMGLYTICFAWEEGAVCKEICHEFFPISITEKEKILKICDDLKIDGIISIASDVAVVTINYVANKLNLVGNSIESSRLSTNKYLMRQVFKEANILIPSFIEVGDNYNIDEIKKLKFPIIIKPVDRSGSKGITVLNSYKGIDQAVNYALNESFIKKVILEEFIHGEEISVEAISFNGNHRIITYTDKVTSNFPHFVELEHHQPSKFFNSDISKKIRNIVLNGLNSLLIKNGASHSELIITKDKDIYLTEIGARMGGDFIGSDLVRLSTGYDYLSGVIEVSLGKFNIPILDNVDYSGVYFYSSLTENVKDAYIEYSENIVQYSFDDKLKEELKQSADRSGYFIYQSKSKLIL